ncbi:chromosome partitioning protein ParA [Glaesserella parasuis]|uniref:chromosome partitioning protein ParA n=1 Tax=Glaesserella parasuis TaxID=738 RepID=UPI00094F9143|nr:chromosome partitioning protein ParA [Glaesserella parasuis]MDG6262546.1 chromosome partitioning protein ParA [Glaesserella parasuis]MDG6304879.1 chromosome partitioning protein ParA [Glaesserella parasuis]MDG6313590.1 chromosome partitioning protein ParA [Glaesserella parasuis]MDG6326466.1 chromosome partitioning protein ParA [Glaesserella parasuis]MDG6330679.1 chromosome partitioning protein ParA [Glaesserella parasuis]
MNIFNKDFLVLFGYFEINKFIKIITLVLCMMFLSSCDNVGKHESINSTSLEKTSKEDVHTVESSASIEAVEDFNKLVLWNIKQEQVLAELQQKLSSQDKSEIEDGLNIFKTRISSIIQNLEMIEVKNTDIQLLKLRIKENLILLNDFIIESVETMQNPTLEGQEKIKEKSDRLLLLNKELQKFESDLKEKFGIK